MRRRRLLSVFTLSLAGCVDDGSSSVTPDPDDPVLFVVTNRQSDRATAQLTLTRDDGGSLIDESVTLDAGESREYDPGIDRPGRYDLTVALVDGLRRTLMLTIEPSDIRDGSNHEAILRDNSVQVSWEA